MLSTTLIDDFGLKPLKAGQDEDFHDLVAERYERTATVITSNLKCGALHFRFNAVNTLMLSSRH